MVRFKRICKRCGKKFVPEGKDETLCYDCWFQSKSRIKGKKPKIKC